MKTDRRMREIMTEILQDRFGTVIVDRMRQLSKNKWKIECSGEPQQRILGLINDSNHPVTWGNVEPDHIIVMFS